jgi:hypothetical protein
MGTGLGTADVKMPQDLKKLSLQMAGTSHTLYLKE